MGDFQLFPDQASTMAGQVDALYYTLTALTLLFAIPIPFVILYFMVKYHHARDVPRALPTHTNLRMELGWMFGLLALSMGVFVWSALLYFNLYPSAPADTLDIYVIGRQWMWKAQHPQGKRENNELHVPVGVKVKLIMTSQDVIHSFYIPAFRIKQDVLPGRYTTMWFEPTKPGEYNLFCAEYCGTEHSMMRGRVVVMEQADYQRWLREDLGVIPENAAPSTSGAPAQAPSSGQDTNTLAAAGAQLFQQQGCTSCHVAQRGARGIAPSLVGVFGSQVQLADGSTVTADENYLRNSILNPQAQIVAGYQPVMPSFAGRLTEEQVIELVEYIKSLKTEEGTQ